MSNTPHFQTPAAVVSALLAGALGAAEPSAAEPASAPHPYVGMWVTEDRHVRHELLPNGRYDEARGTRESAYQGRYTVSGNRIDYVDDTGFTADGVFVEADVLHHGGMVLRRVAPDADTGAPRDAGAGTPRTAR
ncbi:Atu4866 domain-containing protein [Luteimonas kalidii]|uniref:Atu4866 domain-containing protein n=1 Tax=Luteimonas kalidii TaxID=3042025 RepID=A0ABT6JQ96_9GAMM|nr:Atu4866 domain-containing protein [Luteimonas kalidii]MDH5832852.1 Atu4866 domain-containing protein [Luteimonas kalidii]